MCKRAGNRDAVGVSHLFRDDFVTDAAAALSTPHTCEPGPGSVVVAGSLQSISGGAYTIATEGSSNGLYGSSTITRATGLMLYSQLRFASLGASTQVKIGWRNAASIGSACSPGLHIGLASGTLQAIQNSRITALSDTFSVNTTYEVLTVCRSTGGFLLYRALGQVSWTLAFVEAVSTGDSRPHILHNTTVATMPVWCVPQQLWTPPAIASDSFNRADGAAGSTDGAGHAEGSSGSGIAWQALTGATLAIASNKFTATSAPGVVDCGTAEIVATADMDANASGHGVVIRATDESNYWIVLLTTTALTINQVTGGSLTERATVAVTGGTGERVEVVASGNTIRAFHFTASATATCVYASASQGNTATKHGLLGSASFDNFVVWPRKMAVPFVGVAA